MSTSISLGKARIFNFSVSAAGNPDTTTPATATTSNQAVLRVTMNPSNNRQFAAVALGAGTTNANASCGGVTSHALVTVPAPPPPDALTIDEAGVGPEIDPPSWA